MSVMGFADKNMRKPQDIIGKTVAITPADSLTQIWPLFLETGLKESDVKIVAGDAQTKLNAVINGRADLLLGAVMDQSMRIKDATGKDVYCIRFADYGINLVGDGVIANTDFVKQNSDLVRRFMAATTQAVEDAAKAPEETVDAILAADPKAGKARNAAAGVHAGDAVLHDARDEGQTALQRHRRKHGRIRRADGRIWRPRRQRQGQSEAILYERISQEMRMGRRVSKDLQSPLPPCGGGLGGGSRQPIQVFVETHDPRGQRDPPPRPSPTRGRESAAATPRAVIEIAGASKTYRTRDGDVPSLRPLDFTINDGEFFVVVGPSGCGKSTLLKMLAGLLAPTTGAIRLEGKSVIAPHGDVGIVFQSPLLLPWRNVLKNVMLPVDMKRLPRALYLARAEQLLKMVGLSGFERKMPWQLSGGMQQRASICRALIHDPKIMLMDEPFGALDAMTRERMNVELQRIQRETGKTIFLITHSIPEAVFLADRVLVMTERPGAVAAIYDVPLPRPRTLEMMADPLFVALSQSIRRHFATQGRLD